MTSALTVPDPQDVSPVYALTVRSFDVVESVTARRVGGVRLTETAGFVAVPSGRTHWTLTEAVEDVLSYEAALQRQAPADG